MTDWFKNINLSQKDFVGMVCDPPSLTSSSKHRDASKKAHEQVLYKSLQYLKSGGIFAFASCTYHYTWFDFIDSVHKVGVSLNADLKIDHMGGASGDHPMHVHLPETQYLKCAMGTKI